MTSGLAASRRHALRLGVFSSLLMWRPAISANALGSPNVLVSGDINLPSTPSLKESLALAHTKRQPLLVFVSLEGCAYCRDIRTRYMRSLLTENQVPIVQVDMRKRTPLESATGESTTHRDQIQWWGVRVAPTLLFLGLNGKELAERLVGGDAVGFYGAYLDERLQTARKSIVSG